jgi:hypothetical protein
LNEVLGLASWLAATKDLYSFSEYWFAMVKPWR